MPVSDIPKKVVGGAFSRVFGFGMCLHYALGHAYTSMEHGDGQISPLVRKLMLEASEEELVQATKNFREFLGVLYRMYGRLEAERHFKRRNEREGDHHRAQ